MCDSWNNYKYSPWIKKTMAGDNGLPLGLRYCFKIIWCSGNLSSLADNQANRSRSSKINYGKETCEWKEVKDA